MVRLAEDKDIIGILKVIRQNIHVVKIRNAEKFFSSQKTALVIKNSIANQICTVAIHEGLVVGVCLGIANLNVFCDETKEIQLLVNVINEEHKGTTLGGRNFIEWCAIVKALCKDNRQIVGVWVAEQPEGTNIDFGRRGFKRSHTNWLLLTNCDDDGDDND